MGLRLNQSPLRPVQIFQRFAHSSRGIQYALHAFKLDIVNALDLKVLLSSKTYPFQSLYDTGCRHLVDGRRQRALHQSIRRFGGMNGFAERLLSVSCLSRIPKIDLYLSQNCSARILSTHSQLPFPSITERDFGSGIAIASSAEGTNLDELIPRPELLQNCSWLYEEDGPGSSYATQPPVWVLGSPKGWMALHHSCYIPPPVTSSSTIKLVVRALVQELPPHSLFLSMMAMKDIAQLARWCLQLTLVMFHIVGRTETGAEASPIYNYLNKVKNRLIWAPEDGLGGTVRLLKTFLKGILGYYETAKMKENWLPSFASMRTLISTGLYCDRHHLNRWLLDLAWLYHSLAPTDIQREHLNDIGNTLQTASPIEIQAWLRFPFLPRGLPIDVREGLITGLGRFNSMQLQLLRDQAQLVLTRSLSCFSFIVSAIPFDIRLQFARERFVENGALQSQLQRLMKGGETVQHMVNRYMSKMRQKGIIGVHGNLSITRFRQQTAGLLAFILNTAWIMEARLPQSLNGHQLKLILGYVEETLFSIDGPGFNMEEYFKVDYTVEWYYGHVGDAIEVSRRLLPVIFTWHEFFSHLLQNKA